MGKGPVFRHFGDRTGLLLALLDNPSAAEVLRACSANIDDLRKSLANFIKDNTPQVAGTDEEGRRRSPGLLAEGRLGQVKAVRRPRLHLLSVSANRKDLGS